MQACTNHKFTRTDTFPALAPDLAAACVARYQALGIWNRTPVLARDGFKRLKASCLSGGLIRRDTPYETCVDNRHAATGDSGSVGKVPFW